MCRVVSDSVGDKAILSEKRERGMALKKRGFTPESGNVDTYIYVHDLHAIYSG